MKWTLRILLLAGLLSFHASAFCQGTPEGYRELGRRYGQKMLSLTASLNLSAAEILKNPDGSGAYATGKYRNLIAEIGKSQPEIRPYCEGLLYMMALLHCGGEFRIW